MKVYGIKNCDTVKKACAWLTEHKLDFEFIDFKINKPTSKELDRWEKILGWEVLLNRKGTTWRKLLDAEKNMVTDAASAKEILLENPSAIKRPILEINDMVYAGFSPESYNSIFTKIKNL